jgi:hypothetical protein
MHARRLAIIATCATLALGLSACFQNPVESLVEQVIEDQTGIDVETGGTGGQSASIPASWPDLPVPAGQIMSTIAVDKTFALTILVDSEEEIERVIADLVAQGYTETARADYGGFKSVALHSSDWAASFGWAPEEDSGKFLLNYGVSATG